MPFRRPPSDSEVEVGGRGTTGSRPALSSRGPRSVLGRVQPGSRRGDFLSPASPRTRRLGGVYLVASPQKPVSRLRAIVTAALEGGVSAVQLRDKGVYSPEERAEAGRALRDLSREFGVPFLVNDDPQLARRMDADGVHVGRDDPSPRIARAVLGPQAIIGVTVYGKPGEESAAAEAGADYVAVGPFFPSPTKPEEPVLPMRVLDAVVHRSPLPVFAIGGVTPTNAILPPPHPRSGVAGRARLAAAPRLPRGGGGGRAVRSD